MKLRLAALALLLSGCSIVKAYRVEPDWDATDRTRVKRIAVVTSIAYTVPGKADASPSEKVRQLWSLIARRYVNQKREFIAKKDLVGAPDKPAEGVTVFIPKTLCEEGIEGVLWLDPKLNPKGDGVEASVDAQLSRCSDGAVVWQAQGGGSWPSRDSLLVEMTSQYATKLGPEVEPYVAPSFRLLRAVLDTLPNCELNDADKDEKIALDD